MALKDLGDCECGFRPACPAGLVSPSSQRSKETAVHIPPAPSSGNKHGNYAAIELDSGRAFSGQLSTAQPDIWQVGLVRYEWWVKLGLKSWSVGRHGTVRQTATCSSRPGTVSTVGTGARLTRRHRWHDRHASHLLTSRGRLGLAGSRLAASASPVRPSPPCLPPRRAASPPASG